MFRSVSSKLPKRSELSVQGTHVNKVDMAHALKFAELKTAWAIQVAADKELSITAVRIALVWPFWLNSKTLDAWPSQSTIAKKINSKPRAVRDALKRLEKRGHLYCTNASRGGRKTNRYRILLQGVVKCEENLSSTESGTCVPVTPACTDPSDRQDDALQNGAIEPGTEASTDRKTLERTIERTKSGAYVPNSNETPVEPVEKRVSEEVSQGIMREYYGDDYVNGHVHRK